ncbi:hypothetical protein ABMA28_009255 [Loxostege sticticalis]|uniref:Tc1-like transposase DDE domain-containing protein n=1 Tax=Loxostege sticticalis TaxID=481309 RepID=A0ABD0SDA3_LOXSC
MPRPRNVQGRYTNEQYLQMVLLYDLTNNLVLTQEMFHQRYPDAPIPSRDRILRTTQNLLDFASFHVPVHAQDRGRAPVYPMVLYRQIRRYFISNPQASTRQAARQFGVSQYYVWKILNSSGQHPYHFQKVQELTLADYAPRLQFCNWLLQNVNANILWTDESTFTRIGLFNIHNEHWWSQRGRNPHKTRRDAFQHRFSVNVWAGILNDRIIGPHFIEGRLTGENYLQLLRDVVEEQLEEVPISNLAGLYYQHDGAPAHFQHAVRAYLNERFGERWIGRGGPVPWPARSPDLTPLDFFLWGEIKRLVYESESETRDELKDKIIAAFETVKTQSFVLNRVKNNHRRRAELCVERGGEHFEHLLKYV